VHAHTHPTTQQQQAVSPFLDPVTKAKVEFVYSKDLATLKAAESAGAPAAVAAAPAPSRSVFAGVFATVALAAPPAGDSSTARFLPYAKYLQQPFDKSGHFDKLAKFGWKL